MSLYRGQNMAHLEMEIDNPKLWWPYDLGEPFCYDLNIVVKENEINLDKISAKVGLREIKMQRNPGVITSYSIHYTKLYDSDDTGKCDYGTGKYD